MKSPFNRPKQVRVASAITRAGPMADARSISTASNLYKAKSSNGSNLRKPRVSKGKKNNALAKKISKNRQFVTKHIDNFVMVPKSPLPPQQAPLPRTRPGSAAPLTGVDQLVKVNSSKQLQEVTRNNYPPRFPREHLNQEIAHDLARSKKESER